MYKGVPGTFAGVPLSSKVYGSDVYLKDLRETTQDHYKNNVVKVDGLEAADRIIEKYKEEAEEQKQSKAKSEELNKNNTQNKEQNKTTNNH